MAQRETAEEQARVGALTRLPNRRAFDERLTQLQAQHERHGSDYALVLFDLDPFKSLNDLSGHRAGDAVLAMVARILRDCCRMPDQVSRYGGEEFALLIPGCTASRAGWLAERCRFRIEMARLRLAGRSLQITVSAGVAQAIASQAAADLIARADAALYEAKKNGRNCVRVDGEIAAGHQSLAR
jgi:diguanylate cyclase (GGDEF)-like protein